MARAFPTAIPRGLQLVSDWTMTFCLLDDFIEKLGTSDEVAEYLHHLLDRFRGHTTGPIEDPFMAGKDPFMAGMMDLRHRLLAMAPENQLERFADRLEELFSSYVAEARNRERAQIPSVAAYLPLREVTIGLHVMFSLADLLEGFDLPDHLDEHPALRELATRACYIVGWANDLFTYEKEILQGELHNLVLVIMTERQLTITEAVAEVVAMHDDEVRCFLEDVDALPLFGTADAGARRYVEMLTCWIRGHLDWAHETGRYRPFEEPIIELPRRAVDAPAAA